MAFTTELAERRAFVRRLIGDMDTVGRLVTDEQIDEFEMEAISEWSALFPHAHRTTDVTTTFSASGIGSKRRTVGSSGVAGPAHEIGWQNPPVLGDYDFVNINCDPGGTLTTGTNCAVVVMIAMKNPAGNPELTRVVWGGGSGGANPRDMERLVHVNNGGGNLSIELWLISNPLISSSAALSIRCADQNTEWTCDLWYVSSFNGSVPAGYVGIQDAESTYGVGTAISTVVQTPTAFLFPVNDFLIIDAAAFPSADPSQGLVNFGFIGTTANDVWAASEKTNTSPTTTMAWTLAAPQSYLHLAVAWKGGPQGHHIRIIKANNVTSGKPLAIAGFQEVCHLQETEGRSGAGLATLIGIQQTGVTVERWAIYPSGANEVSVTFEEQFLGLVPGQSPGFDITSLSRAGAYAIDRVAAYRLAAILGAPYEKLDQIIAPLPFKVLEAFNLTAPVSAAHLPDKDIAAWAAAVATANSAEW